MILTDGQVEQYRAHGYLFPLDLFDAAQVDAINADYRAAREDAGRLGLESEWPLLTRANAHYLMPFVHRTACTPGLLDAVESLLGPDLLRPRVQPFRAVEPDDPHPPVSLNLNQLVAVHRHAIPARAYAGAL